MFRSALELKNYSLRATDGEIGRLKDFYFDDVLWTIRYIVVETGAWLKSRQVLLAPEALHAPEWGEQVFPVNLTKEQVRHSPPADTAQPVTRQYERQLREYYNWPIYPGAIYMLEVPPPQPPAPVNPHLFSTNSVTGYHLEATDGDIGHVADFLFDEATWKIAFLEIDTRNWLPGRHVLLGTEWVRHIDWQNSHLEVDLTCAAINSSPAYDANRYITQEYVTALRAHYGSSRKPGST